MVYFSVIACWRYDISCRLDWFIHFDICKAPQKIMLQWPLEGFHKSNQMLSCFWCTGEVAVAWENRVRASLKVTAFSSCILFPQALPADSIILLISAGLYVLGLPEEFLGFAYPGQWFGRWKVEFPCVHTEEGMLQSTPSNASFSPQAALARFHIFMEFLNYILP